MPADVADHGVHGAVRGADDVVEVTAEQGARAAGAVAGGEAEGRALQQRGRQEPSLQAAVLLCAHAALGEPPLGRVGTFPLHGVADRAAQQSAVQFVPEEVVLGADPHCLGAAFGVAGRGEREDGVPGRELQYVLEHGELVVVTAAARGRQREVQQDAVDVVGQQPRGLGEVAGRAHADRPAGRVLQFGYDRGAAGIVLDQQQRQVGGGGVVVDRGFLVRDLVRGGAASWCGLRLTTLRGRDRSLPRYGYGHRLEFLPSPEGTVVREISIHRPGP